MSTVLTEARHRPEDLLTMPDGNRFELVDGQLVERIMSMWSSYVAGRVYKRIDSFCESHQLGWALPEGTTYQCFRDDPDKVRKADASFIARERMTAAQALEPGHARIAPDLAVEVVSPNDKHYEVKEKVQDYLDAGVRLVWVVDPENRVVEVHRAQKPGTIVHEQDALDGEDVLPGFRCPIAELFQPPPGVAAAQPEAGKI